MDYQLIYETGHEITGCLCLFISMCYTLYIIISGSIQMLIYGEMDLWPMGWVDGFGLFILPVICIIMLLTSVVIAFLWPLALSILLIVGFWGMLGILHKFIQVRKVNNGG